MAENEINALLENLLKTNNLPSLVDEESQLFRQVRMLNSEFHTLLYENYNKLISAAQIIGQMSNNFDHMEQDINSISVNMKQIIKQSDHLSDNLSDKFKNLTKLSTTYSRLKRLQFSSDLDDLVVKNGLNLACMLMDSVEEENWITDQKPRHVRPVVIKLIEDINLISENLEKYCEDGTHTELTGQHSLYHSRSAQTNNPLMNNIKKLFSERIEIFQPVSFERRSILTGIVKIALKALIESVRLRTFNKNGIQQLQIDAKYLQHELSRYVSDENVIFALLDEAITSSELRCFDNVE